MNKRALFTVTLFFLLPAFMANADNHPQGYELVAYENESKTFNRPVDLAYGANGRYHFIDNFTGTIRFDNRTFGGDPIDGVNKAGYVRTRNSNNNQYNNQNMDDFEFVANENETRTFQNPVDLAYGANGQYHYIENFTGTIRFDNRTFGGDPIEGVNKSGYAKRMQNNHYGNQNLDDYKFIANEGETKTFHRPTDLAYGANGRYHYIENFTGTIRFDNRTFGGDPIEGVNKSGYMRRSNAGYNGDNQNMDDYRLIANENETKTFNRRVDLAYGANGRYHYINDFTGTIRFDNRTFGGDPIEGVAKSGYVRRDRGSHQNNHGQRDDRDMNDYKLIANENETKTFRRTVDLAYGANGRYHYIENFSGTIRFDNDSFGGDPSPGQVKQGYVREVNQRNPKYNTRNESRRLNKNN